MIRYGYWNYFININARRSTRSSWRPSTSWNSRRRSLRHCSSWWLAFYIYPTSRRVRGTSPVFTSPLNPLTRVMQFDKVDADTCKLSSKPTVRPALGHAGRLLGMEVDLLQKSLEKRLIET